MSEHEQELQPPTEQTPSETPEEPHISSKVCSTCLTDNLMRVVGIASCQRCKGAYCIHFASRIDPVYCLECMSDLSVTKEVIRKEYEVYSEQTDKTYHYARRARQIMLNGLDWLFAQRRISTLTDTELDMYIEYHRVYCHLLQVEAEKRRTEQMHRYANVKMVIPTESTATVTKTTTTKKSKTNSTDKASALMLTMMQQMLAKGMTLDEITKKLMGGI